MLDLPYYAVVIPAAYYGLLYLHKALFLGGAGDLEEGQVSEEADL